MIMVGKARLPRRPNGSPSEEKGGQRKSIGAVKLCPLPPNFWQRAESFAPERPGREGRGVRAHSGLVYESKKENIEGMKVQTKCSIVATRHGLVIERNVISQGDYLLMVNHCVYKRGMMPLAKWGQITRKALLGRHRPKY